MSCTRLMLTDTRDRASVFRYIDWNRAFQTISSRGTTCARGRSARGFVDAGQQHENLPFLRSRSSPVPARERARLVDRVDDRPRERKERDLVPLERQQRVAAHLAAAIVVLERRVEHLRLELDDLVAPAVGDAELQAVMPAYGATTA